MIVAVVPVKRLALAKSRLQPSMSPEERIALVRALLAQTITVLRASGNIGEVVLVTEEVSLGPEFGVTVRPDVGELNLSLRGATEWAEARGRTGALVLPADLPLLRPCDVDALIAHRSAPPQVILAPTRDGGTGALLLTPPTVIQPHFGPHSYTAHIAAAKEVGARVDVVEREAFRHDLDQARDLPLLPPHIQLNLRA